MHERIMVVIAITVLSSMLIEAKPPMRVKSSIKDVLLLQAGDQGFDDWSAASPMGSVIRQLAPELLPYSVVVVNKTAAIVYLGVQFIVHGSGAPGDRGPVYFYRSRAEAPILPAGKSFLVTPSHSLNMIHGPADSVRRVVAAESERQRQWYDHMEAVTVALDSVWFADGRVLGPDKAKNFEMEQAKVDDWNSLIAELRQHKTDKDADDFLRAAVNRPIVGERRTVPLLYARRANATAIMALLAAGAIAPGGEVQKKSFPFTKEGR